MKNVSAMNCTRPFAYTNKVKCKVSIIIISLFTFLTISCFFLYVCAKNSSLFFSLNLPFFKSVDIKTIPVVSINEAIECSPGVTILISSVSEDNNLVAITTDVTNNTDSIQTFNSDQFNLSKQNTEMPYDYTYLKPYISWSFAVNQNSNYSFTQYYYVGDEDCAFTLTMKDDSKAKIGQFLILSSDITYFMVETK